MQPNWQYDGIVASGSKAYQKWVCTACSKGCKRTLALSDDPPDWCEEDTCKR